MTNTGADTITEMMDCYTRREQVSRQFSIPSGLVPDRQVQYSNVGKMYRPDRVVVIYSRYAEFGREFEPWKVDLVSVFGRKLTVSGKLGTTVAKEKLYGLPSEKSWLTDLVRDHMPV